MTEPVAPDATPEGDGGTQSNYTPPATQAELDRIIADRVARTKNQFKDYGQLKAQAEELAQIKAANQTDAQRQAEELSKWQSEAQTWRSAAVGSRIHALAASDFADPTDAVSSLDVSKYLDGGQIDDNAIQADLADLLERKPHWRRSPDQNPRLPHPNPAQGTGEKSPAPNPNEHMNALIRSARSGQ